MEQISLLKKLIDTCPECESEVTIISRVCFGINPHNDYMCYSCGWRGRNPNFAVKGKHER